MNVSEELKIDQILEYSGFDDSSQRTIIAADGFKSYDDIFTLGKSYIMNLAKVFSDRTVAAGKISLGLCRTNIFKANIHWAQGFRRISRTPSLISISNAAKSCAEIEVARQRDRIRKHFLEESASLSKATNTGKLKQHKDRIT